MSYAICRLSFRESVDGCILSLADCSSCFLCSDEISCLIDDLGLVPSDSSQGRAISRFRKLRFCEQYKRAKAVEKKEFQDRFHNRFKKFARVDHSEVQLDCCPLKGLFD